MQPQQLKIIRGARAFRGVRIRQVCGFAIVIAGAGIMLSHSLGYLIR